MGSFRSSASPTMTPQTSPRLCATSIFRTGVIVAGCAALLALLQACHDGLPLSLRAITLGKGFAGDPPEHFYKFARGKERCEFAVVYNKPPKTASTFIQGVITNWTEETRRPNHICANQSLESALYLHECLPRAANPCGVVNCHLVLTPSINAILTRRLPNYRLLTSTRYPPHRIVSNFLQVNLFQAHESAIMHTELTNYLRDKFNPWKLYNYHTGEHRTGCCPLRMEEKTLIVDAVTKYDLVIDANLPHISNAILKHHGLFQLPVQADRVNNRGASTFTLPTQAVHALQNVSCVEQELHKALQMRMASLYEQATGFSCIQHGRPNDLASCVGTEEKEALRENWLF